MTPSVLIRRAQLEGSIVDVHCANGVITHVGVGASGADVVIDAQGGGLIAGLHDHHIHLLALAAARESLPAGPPEVTDAESFDGALRGADRGAPAGDWLRVVGYHEAIAGDLDRRRLDTLVGDRPTRVQHATGSMWVLNSAALARTALDEVIDAGIERDERGRATGRIFGLDALVRERVGPTAPDLAAVGQELAGYGVTGVTDLTPTEAADEVGLLAAQVLAAAFPLGVVVTGGPGLPPTAAPALERGPIKFRLVDHRLPALDELVAGFRRAHIAGRPVAVHCVTRAELVLAVAALADAGTVAGDRIEHGAVVPIELVPTLAALGVVVVTQPSFVHDRGDRYLSEVAADDLGDLWRCGSLIEGGVGVAAGTDAPYGHPDPWRAIASAGQRTTRNGAALGAAERVPADVALGMFLTPAGDPTGPARAIAVGGRAELCLLNVPLTVALEQPSSEHVRATISRAGVVERC